MNTFQIDLLGWIGFSFIITGYYFNAKRKINCFYIWGIGNRIYILYGFIIDAIPIIGMSIFVLIMNVYGYYHWNDSK